MVSLKDYLSSIKLDRVKRENDEQNQCFLYAESDAIDNYVRAIGYKNLTKEDLNEINGRGMCVEDYYGLEGFNKYGSDDPWFELSNWTEAWCDRFDKNGVYLA